MILSLLQSGNSPFEILLSLIIVVPAMMLALSVHETAHGFAAWKCGDPTAHNLGRLTLNPIRHLDPVGLIMLLLVGYGWAKSGASRSISSFIKPCISSSGPSNVR